MSIDALKQYSLDDITKWAGSEDASTVRVMNQIRADAPKGQTSLATTDKLTEYVEFGCDDVTAKATIREQEELSVDNLALHGTPGLLHVVAAAGEEAAVGAGLVGAAFVIELAATGKEIIAGDQIAAAVQRDSMHAAMLASLDLAQGYKDEAMGQLMSKYTEGWQGAAQRVAEQALREPGKMALVQLHADQGANAARRMCEGGVDRRAFFGQNLDAARRYATDPAFKQGFDSIVWAKGHGEAEYKSATTALEARDARYTQAHVRFSV